MTFRCTCGHVANLGESDDIPWGWVTLPADALEDYIHAQAEMQDLTTQRGSKAEDRREIAEGKIRSAEGKLFECPACRRLHWRGELDSIFRVYKPDESA